MRTLLLTAFAWLIGFGVHAQSPALDRFYAAHQDAGFTASSSNGDNLLGSVMKSADNAKAHSIFQKVKKVRLLVFSEGQAPAAGEWKALFTGLREEQFDDLFVLRKGKGSVKILSADLKSGLREIVFIGHGDGDFIVDLTGDFSDKDMGDLKVLVDEGKKEG